MPIYEYKCDDCGTEFEALVFSAADMMAVACKKCESPKVVKLMSGAAVGHSGEKSPCSTGACDFSPSRHSCGGGCGCGG